ncbi:hypothetical protein DMX06_14410 [Pseudomonas mosselii]|nr:hypothetical protein DMX06_14410 [Pseudomonas mosselii]
MNSCAGLFAGKPAPTGFRDCAKPVGAGLPAKRPAQANRLARKDFDNKFKKGETPWPKQKYSVARACVARWPARPRCRPSARPGPA